MCDWVTNRNKETPSDPTLTFSGCMSGFITAASLAQNINVEHPHSSCAIAHRAAPGSDAHVLRQRPFQRLHDETLHEAWLRSGPHLRLFEAPDSVYIALQVSGWKFCVWTFGFAAPGCSTTKGDDES